MAMNRRSFLGKAASAGLAAGAGALFSGCGAVTRSDLPRTDPKPLPTGLIDDRRRRILYYASLAPSGHNAQPWAVRILGPDEWIIEADPSRLLPAVDPDNRETLLSLGAFAENLALAAGAFGFETQIEVLAREKTDLEVMRVRLSECTPSDYPVRRLEKRMTVKSGYLPRELAASDVDAFASVLPEAFTISRAEPIMPAASKRERWSASGGSPSGIRHRRSL